MIALQIFVSALVTFVVYGTTCLLVARKVARSNAKFKVLIGALLFLFFWLPCMFLGLLLAGLIPLEWGHGGGAYVLVNILASVLVFALSILLLYGEAPAKASKTETINVICSNCRGQVSFGTSACPHCGFRFS